VAGRILCPLTAQKSHLKPLGLRALTVCGLAVVTTAQRVYLPPVAGVNSAFSCGPWSRSTSASPRGALRPRRSGTKRRAPAPPFCFAEAVRPVLRSQALPALVSNATEPSGAFRGERGRLNCGRSAPPSDYSQCVRFGHLDGCA